MQKGRRAFGLAAMNREIGEDHAQPPGIEVELPQLRVGVEPLRNLLRDLRANAAVNHAARECEEQAHNHDGRQQDGQYDSDHQPVFPAAFFSHFRHGCFARITAPPEARQKGPAPAPIPGLRERPAAC